MDKQKENKPVSYRLPEKIKSLVSILSEKLLISKTAVITIAITKLAKNEKILDDIVQLNMEDLAAEVGKQFAADISPIAEAIAAVADSMKDMQKRLEKLEENKSKRESLDFYQNELQEKE